MMNRHSIFSSSGYEYDTDKDETIERIRKSSATQLVELWKEHKHLITTHTRIDEWLPYLVKSKLAPTLIPRATYPQLRKYSRIWENRDLVTALPKLRGEHTHKLDEMNGWIRYQIINLYLFSLQSMQ